MPPPLPLLHVAFFASFITCVEAATVGLTGQFSFLFDILPISASKLGPPSPNLASVLTSEVIEPAATTNCTCTASKIGTGGLSGPPSPSLPTISASRRSLTDSQSCFSTVQRIARVAQNNFEREAEWTSSISSQFCSSG